MLAYFLRREPLHMHVRHGFELDKVLVLKFGVHGGGNARSTTHNCGGATTTATQKEQQTTEEVRLDDQSQSCTRVDKLDART